MTSKLAVAMIVPVALTAAACGSGRNMPMGPGGPSGATAALVSVSPGGGMTGVPTGTSLQLQWGAAMGSGMEQYVDLHMGSLSGPTVPLACAWSTDHTTLVCTPSSPLQPGTPYVIHVGGGMMDADGQPVDMGQYGPGYGGQWIQGGMMGSGHAGMPWGMMGGGWERGGLYGMAFTFTTA